MAVLHFLGATLATRSQGERGKTGDGDWCSRGCPFALSAHFCHFSYKKDLPKSSQLTSAEKKKIKKNDAIEQK